MDCTNTGWLSGPGGLCWKCNPLGGLCWNYYSGPEEYVEINIISNVEIVGQKELNGLNIWPGHCLLRSGLYVFTMCGNAVIYTAFLLWRLSIAYLPYKLSHFRTIGANCNEKNRVVRWPSLLSIIPECDTWQSGEHTIMDQCRGQTTIHNQISRSNPSAKRPLLQPVPINTVTGCLHTAGQLTPYLIFTMVGRGLYPFLY